MFDRASAHKVYGELVNSPADYAEACRADLFFLMVYAMNRKDMDNDWCFARCREVQANPDGYLDLWAREHYKSTIITVGLTIRDILRDPDVTVGIFSHTRPIAKAFLRQIKREFETNALLQDLFPHIRPPSGKDGRKWSEDDGIVVHRAANPKEATVEAWGLVDGQPTSKHFFLLIYDDVVTRESVGTPEQIKKTTEAWELSLNLGAHGGRRRMIGTRYHHFDTWRAIMDRGAAVPRIYPATEDGTATGRPVFLSPEVLTEKRRDQGPYTFSAQMLQNPTADKAQGFREEWLRWYTPGKLPACNFYLLCDPAGAKKKDSDYTVMWVVGLGEDGNIYIVDGLHDRLNLTERAEALFRLRRKYMPLAVGYEQYGMQADIEHIRDMQEREGYRFAVTPLGGSMPKADRIRRLVPAFQQSRVYLPKFLRHRDLEGKEYDLAGDFVEQEYTPFPVCAHDDMLDCLARIFDLPARFPGKRPVVAAGTDTARRAATEYDVAGYGMEMGR